MVKKVPAQVPKCNPIIRHSSGEGVLFGWFGLFGVFGLGTIGHQPLWPDLTQIGADSLA